MNVNLQISVKGSLINKLSVELTSCFRGHFIHELKSYS